MPNTGTGSYANRTGNGYVVIEEQVLVPTQPLTQEVIEDYRKLFFPSLNEWSGIISWLKQERGWSVGYIESMTGVSRVRLVSIYRKESLPKGPEARAIWVYWALDVAPHCALDVFFHATWGKVQGKLPLNRELTPTQVKRIEKHFALLKRDGYRHTLDQIRSDLNKHFVYLMPHEVGRWCYKFGYYPVTTTRKSALPKARILDPFGIWMNMDWRKSDEKLAEVYSQTVERVAAHRRTLEKMGKNELLAHLMATGRNPDYFEPLIKL